jgi:hypothetical protein
LALPGYLKHVSFKRRSGNPASKESALAPQATAIKRAREVNRDAAIHIERERTFKGNPIAGGSQMLVGQSVFGFCKGPLARKGLTFCRRRCYLQYSVEVAKPCGRRTCELRALSRPQNQAVKARRAKIAKALTQWYTVELYSMLTQ